MEFDVFVHKRTPGWRRLDQLVGRRRLTGAEADELVTLYQLASADLAHLQVVAPEPIVLAQLTDLVARARAKAVGARTGVRQEIVTFFAYRFPAVLYRSWPWWVSVAGAFLLVATVIGVWVANDPNVQATIGSAEEIERVTAPGGEFETYYSENPAPSFAAQVWTNNAWVAAIALFMGVLIVPAVYVLVMNAVNIGVSGGLMADAGRLDAFFGFIAPHGILELTAIFVAGGAGLQLGWTLIDPGGQSRVQALARQGQAVGAMALGLVVVFLFAGTIEAFVTPSSLGTPIRVGVGVFAEALFLTYVFVLGSRAAEAGYTGAHRSIDGTSEPSLGKPEHRFG